MKSFKILSLAVILCATVALTCSCVLDDKNYVATDDKYFTFTKVDGGYSVGAKNVEDLPEKTYVPKEHDGEAVVAISDGAFNNSSVIKSVTIPSSVKYIGVSAFSCCTNLKTVVMEKGIKSIGDYAFYCAEKLNGAELPESLTTIGKSAFEGCALTDVDLLKGVVSVGDKAFRNCAFLTDVYVGMNVRAIGENVFDGVNKNVKFTVSDSNPYFVVRDGVISKK